ncbi:hypothetical protein DRE_06704 [Drechslerella stenobrocha 248]|uniref:Large ribosomal subunit protein mL49 n=1 Tax=Drechslerella stenobrocha 248 TaxID=1043628 RepID=W7HWU6_9PEZI|nr:hypothetical protein DRE_06704 [Drechslerella stenobrocha 248]
MVKPLPKLHPRAQTPRTGFITLICHRSRSPGTVRNFTSSRQLLQTAAIGETPSEASPVPEASITPPTVQPPRAARSPTEHLPYQVVVSKSGNFPVYQKHLKDGTVPWTAVRKIKGDGKAFVDDMCRYLDLKPNRVTIRQPAGDIRIRGKYMKEVKGFLHAKGFKERWQLSPEKPVPST